MFLKRSGRLREMQTPLVSVLHAILEAGEKMGLVKPGIDPLQLYISIAGLSYFYFSNAATLTTAFGRELMNVDELKARRAHAVEVITDYVRLR